MKASPLAVWRSCGTTPKRSQSASSVYRRIGRPAGERAVLLEVQRQVHRVQAAIRHPEAPMALVRRVERADVVIDVMADDHAVAEIFEELLEHLGLLHAGAALVARHTVHCHCCRVLLYLDQRVEGIVQSDLAVLDRHRAHRDEAVHTRVESRGFRVQHDEADRSMLVSPSHVDRIVGDTERRTAARSQGLEPGQRGGDLEEPMDGSKAALEELAFVPADEAGGSSAPLVPWLIPTRA